MDNLHTRVIKLKKLLHQKKAIAVSLKREHEVNMAVCIKWKS
jgi:hypothetical protein